MAPVEKTLERLGCWILSHVRRYVLEHDDFVPSSVEPVGNNPTIEVIIAAGGWSMSISLRSRTKIGDG